MFFHFKQWTTLYSKKLKGQRTSSKARIFTYEEKWVKRSVWL